jgi:hypothetical protein
MSTTKFASNRPSEIASRKKMLKMDYNSLKSLLEKVVEGYQ